MNNSIDQLSEDDIKQRLQELDRDRQELESRLAQQRKLQKNGYVKTLRQEIREHGYEVEEIALALLPKGFLPKELLPKSSTLDSKDTTLGPRYVDPNYPDRYYVRGVLPGWMKQQMAEKGFNPEEKADRMRFKQEYLRWVEA